MERKVGGRRDVRETGTVWLQAAVPQLCPVGNGGHPGLGEQRDIAQ